MAVSEPAVGPYIWLFAASAPRHKGRRPRAVSKHFILIWPDHWIWPFPLDILAGLKRPAIKVLFLAPRPLYVSIFEPGAQQTACIYAYVTIVLDVYDNSTIISF